MTMCCRVPVFSLIGLLAFHFQGHHIAQMASGAPTSMKDKKKNPEVGQVPSLYRNFLDVVHTSYVPLTRIQSRWQT